MSASYMLQIRRTTPINYTWGPKLGTKAVEPWGLYKDLRWTSSNVLPLQQWWSNGSRVALRWALQCSLYDQADQAIEIPMCRVRNPRVCVKQPLVLRMTTATNSRKGHWFQYRMSAVVCQGAGVVKISSVFFDKQFSNWQDIDHSGQAVKKCITWNELQPLSYSDVQRTSQDAAFLLLCDCAPIVSTFAMWRTRQHPRQQVT